jgi:hypothetical protein
MDTNQRNSPKGLKQLDRAKNTHFQAQMKRVFRAFAAEPKTMLQVSFETGILRANICRYVSEWRQEGKIQVIRFGLCPISKHRAGFYSTNPDFFPLMVELINAGLQ